MSTSAFHAELPPLLANAKRFQQLTPEDKAIYGAPELSFLSPPPPQSGAVEKRSRWLEWRAAPYPADRHSEYLCRLPDDLKGKPPRILISATLDIREGLDLYLKAFDKKGRYRVTGKKAINAGYEAGPLGHPRDRAREIHAIIHSSTERQGRPIASSFDQRPESYAFPEYDDSGDPNYRDICTGVFAPDGTLAAYLLGKRVGDHVQYDEIMGHNEHLANDVMYLLHIAFVTQCLEQETVPRCLNYGPWYSGQDPYSATSGLNFWKRKIRFQPAYLIAVSS